MKVHALLFIFGGCENPIALTYEKSSSRQICICFYSLHWNSTMSTTLRSYKRCTTTCRSSGGRKNIQILFVISSKFIYLFVNHSPLISSTFLSLSETYLLKLNVFLLQWTLRLMILNEPSKILHNHIFIASFPEWTLETLCGRNLIFFLS